MSCAKIDKSAVDLRIMEIRDTYLRSKAGRRGGFNQYLRDVFLYRQELSDAGQLKKTMRYVCKRWARMTPRKDRYHAGVIIAATSDADYRQRNYWTYAVQYRVLKRDERARFTSFLRRNHGIRGCASAYSAHKIKKAQEADEARIFAHKRKKEREAHEARMFKYLHRRALESKPLRELSRAGAQQVMHMNDADRLAAFDREQRGHLG
jgi:hypothetical protein